MNLIKKLLIDKSWSFFLDRDGVIKRAIDQFETIDVDLKAISHFSEIFGRIIIVTNKMGVSRNLLMVKDLETVYQFLLNKVKAVNSRIYKINIKSLEDVQRFFEAG